MSNYGTKVVASKCVEILRGFNFEPATIINVGVGSCPELLIWQQSFPKTTLVGIDPRGKPYKWTGDYVRAAAGLGGPKTYCIRCRSTECVGLANEVNHRSVVAHPKNVVPVKCVTIDEVAAKYTPPYFIWMDIEGAEIDALKGATQTLQNTEWINIEMQEFFYTRDHCKQLQELLKSLGYVEHHKHEKSADILYRRETGI